MSGVTANSTPAVLNLFRQQYLPAPDFATATEYYTTEDLLRQLAEGDSNHGLDKSYIENWMHNEGYIKRTLTGMKTVWLLMECKD